jgi:FHA domain
MTLQDPHLFRVDGVPFELLDSHPVALFDPIDHRLGVAKSNNGACLAGFFCEFDVALDRLYLERLQLGDRPQIFSGKKSVQFTKRDGLQYAEYIFRDLQHFIPFSGALLIGRGMVPIPRLHVDHWVPYASEEVYELKFENGKLKARVNQSDSMRKVRNIVAKSRASESHIVNICAAYLRTAFAYIDGPQQLTLRYLGHRPHKHPTLKSTRVEPPIGQKLLIPDAGLDLGRFEHSGVYLAPFGVSKRHLRIIRTEDGLVAKDMLSTNGTTLNGVPFKESRVLQLGDRLTLGNVSDFVVVRESVRSFVDDVSPLSPSKS